uniref:Uncharacterized protein n=1 Tax=Romanomermis culicivorax TaxID=13658 RepID=A0A915JT39_ROMCU
MMDSVSKPTKV